MRISDWSSDVCSSDLADEADADVAFGFIDALEQAYTFIGEMPAAGSPRWSHELNLPGLRTIGLKAFPWLVFYLEFETHVDVWRVLHAKRDIPVWYIGRASCRERVCQYV